MMDTRGLVETLDRMLLDRCYGGGKVLRDGEWLFVSSELADEWPFDEFLDAIFYNVILYEGEGPLPVEVPLYPSKWAEKTARELASEMGFHGDASIGLVECRVTPQGFDSRAGTNVVVRRFECWASAAGKAPSQTVERRDMSGLPVSVGDEVVSSMGSFVVEDVNGSKVGYTVEGSMIWVDASSVYRKFDEVGMGIYEA